MRTPTSKTHYVLAVFWPIYSVLSHGLLFKPGIILNLVIWIIVIFFMNFLIEWSLSFSEKRLVRWGSVFMVCTVYIVAYIAFDFYVLKITILFTGFKPLGLGIRIMLIGIVTTIFLERINWTKAREKAKIENLALQSENIETKFSLLREQVNPDFLFYCLNHLKKMVRSEDPQTESYILKLADVYRQTLNTDRNTILFREELELVQAYMYLMRSGREAAVNFDVQINEASLQYKLPVFALQQVADNCMKYNEFSEDNPLNIRIYQDDIRSVTISNNYSPKAIRLPFDPTQMEIRYAIEGVEDGVYTEKGVTTYLTTLKLI